MTLLTAAEVFRDYQTDGVPGSGPNQVDKRAARALLTLYESLLNGSAAGLAYATLAAINADLAHAANSLAIVYNDPTPANNGTYVKVGASGSGSWSRIGDLPISIVRLTVTGGTANAIIASAPETPSVPGSKLYLLTPTIQNTGATTININGAGAVAIKNAFGSALASGSLLVGSQVLMAFDTDHYQLLISASVDASAILASAQAADVSANAAATSASSTAASVAGTIGTYVIQTYAAAVAGAAIPAAVHAVRLLGRTTVFDGGAVNAIDIGATVPSHAGYWTAPDGRHFEFAEVDEVNATMFGGVPDPSGSGAGSDASPALIAMINYANIKKPAAIRIPAGIWPVDAAMPMVNYNAIIRMPQGGSQATIIFKRYVEASAVLGVFSWGAYAPNIEGCQFAAGGSASGGSFISCILPGANPNIGVLRMRDFYFSGGNRVNQNVHIDGSLNTTAGTLGYRSIQVLNGHSFGTQNKPWNFISCQHVFASNVFSATSGGASTNVMSISGSASIPSDDFHWMGLLAGDVNISYLNAGNQSQFHAPINGNMSVDHTSALSIHGNVAGTITFGAGVSDFQVYGKVAATGGTTPTGTSGKITAAGCVVF